MDLILPATTEIMYAALDFAFAISDLGPHFGPWVLRVNFSHLAQQFAGALIARVGAAMATSTIWSPR
jgi:hypothetical protein